MEKENKNNNTALLIMDVQGITQRLVNEKPDLITSLTSAIETARSRNMPVIYVVVGFRKGFPEVSPDNKAFFSHKTGGLKMDTEEAYKVQEAVAPLEGDIIITKKRVSAFSGSDLEVVLRSKGIKHLVLTGLATSGVVLSTVREAADKDYILTVLSDCCGDLDEEVQRVLTTKIFPRQAGVVTSEEWRMG